MVIQIHINIAFCDETFDDSVSRSYKMFLRYSPYMQCGWWKMFVLIAASNMSFITPAIQFTSSSAQLIIRIIWGKQALHALKLTVRTCQEPFPARNSSSNPSDPGASC